MAKALESSGLAFVMLLGLCLLPDVVCMHITQAVEKGKTIPQENTP